MELIFIGFGEAAYHIATGLRTAGNHLQIGAFDAHANDPKAGPLIQERAAQTNITLFDTLEAACQGARFILCLTSARSALPIALQVMPLLAGKQTYVDMNSAAPTVKQAIEAIPRNEGVDFCDAAVMGTVPGNQHRVPILLAGSGASDVYRALSPLGMRLTVLDAEPGAASAIKMLKSVVMKGLPQLFIEAFQGAEKFNVVETLASSLADSLNGKSVEQLANTFTARTLIHARRRSAEMDDVVATLQALGVDAGMSKAAQAKLETQSTFDWAALLGRRGSDMDYQTAIKYLVKHA